MEYKSGDDKKDSPLENREWRIVFWIDSSPLDTAHRHTFSRRITHKWKWYTLDKQRERDNKHKCSYSRNCAAAATGHYWLVPLAATWERLPVVIVTASVSSVNVHKARTMTATHFWPASTRERPRVFSWKLPEPKREARDELRLTHDPKDAPVCMYTRRIKHQPVPAPAGWWRQAKHSRFFSFSCAQIRSTRPRVFAKPKDFPLDDDSSRLLGAAYR